MELVEKDGLHRNMLVLGKEPEKPQEALSHREGG